MLFRSVSRIKIMADMNIAERRLPQDGRIKITIAGRQIDVRVSIVPTVFGERAVMRLLDKTTAMLGLGELGMQADTLTKFRRLISVPHGIILATGPTGSGKSTVARLLDRFYDVREGTITIDGTELRDVTLPSLRANVGVVLDEPFLFSASVADNIAYVDAVLEEGTAHVGPSALVDFVARKPGWLFGDWGIYLGMGRPDDRLARLHTLQNNCRSLLRLQQLPHSEAH